MSQILGKYVRGVLVTVNEEDIDFSVFDYFTYVVVTYINVLRSRFSNRVRSHEY